MLSSLRFSKALLLALLFVLHFGAQAAPNERPTKSSRIYDRVQVITVGINETIASENSGPDKIPRLSAAESDAKAVFELFRDNYEYDCLPPLLGASATKEAILKSLQNAMADLGANDALIVFIACHGKAVDKPGGGTAGFLVPFDASLSLAETDIDLWEKRTIPIATITSILEKSGPDARDQPKGKHVVLILDTCSSGFATRRGGTKISVDQLILANAPSRKAIVATSENRPAVEANGYGIFTRWLLTELRTKRVRNLTEVFEDVRSRVLADRDAGALMRPQMGSFGEGDGEFVFIPKSSAVDRSQMEQAYWTTIREFSLRGTLLSTVDDVIAASQAQDYRYSVDRRQEKEASWGRRLKRFEENAALSDPLALAGLHYCYSKGLGVERTDKNRGELDQKAYLGRGSSK